MNAIERQLAEIAATPQVFATPERPQVRLDENLLVIHAELDAPRESRLARALRRLGVPDLTVPLVTATPALRRSWFVAVAIAVLFALTAAGNNTGSGVDQISVFLTLAPLVPLLGVALAFGRGADPTHELVVAAPRDTFRVFLIRSTTVLVASAAILAVSSILLPAGGGYRIAWLLPSIALTAISMALSSHFDARRSAAAVAGAWIVLVLIVSGGASVAAAFGPATQVASAVVACLAVWFLVRSRARFDQGTVA